MQRFALVSGSILAGLSVILGAFGAHALKARLLPEQLQVFHTAVNYQFWHSLALLFVGLLMFRSTDSMLNYAVIALLAGIVFFSGSLYLLSTSSINGLESLKPVMGPVTPLGGLCFIAGWSMLVIALLKIKL